MNHKYMKLLHFTGLIFVTQGIVAAQAICNDSAGFNCEPITVPMCSSGIGWKMTRYPNHLGQMSQETAGIGLQMLSPLVLMNCSPHLRPFLCAVYTPPCTKAGKPIPVCRSLCRTVKRSCRNLLRQFGFPWPFDCRRSSYIANDDESCIGVDGTVPSAVKTTPATRITSRYSSTPFKHCRNSQLIEIPICKGLTWNITSFPNYLNHQTQDEAGLEAHQFWPLVKVQCSAYLKDFLCSMYTPPCSSGRLLLPCKSLCEAAKQGCEPLMNRYGFQWPQALQCHKLSDDSLCHRASLPPGFAAKPSTTTPISSSSMTFKPSSTSRPARRCSNSQAVTIPMCRSMPWNVTSFPNFLNHQEQSDAGLELDSFKPVIRVNCSPYLREFLCSMYTPSCASGRLLPPCKALCEASRQGCEPLMNKFNFRWPSMLQCDRFSNMSPCFLGSLLKSILSTTVTTTSPAVPNVTGKPNVQTTYNTPPSNGLRLCLPAEPMNTPLCQGVGWNTTSFPNLLNHTTQDDASLQIHQFFPLVKVQCSPRLKKFLCAMYVPPCVSRSNRDASRVYPVCRSLCQAARSGCEPLMKKFGFRWPESLDCNHSPFIVADDQLCVG